MLVFGWVRILLRTWEFLAVVACQRHCWAKSSLPNVSGGGHSSAGGCHCHHAWACRRLWLHPSMVFPPFFSPSLPFYWRKKAAAPVASLARHVGLRLLPPEFLLPGSAQEPTRVAVGSSRICAVGALCRLSPKGLPSSSSCPGRRLAHLLMDAHTGAMQS